jgi:hypothetical protein
MPATNPDDAQRARYSTTAAITSAAPTTPILTRARRPRYVTPFFTACLALVTITLGRGTYQCEIVSILATTCQRHARGKSRNSLRPNSAGGGTRTRTGFPPRDFKSLASTDFATPAVLQDDMTADSEATWPPSRLRSARLGVVRGSLTHSARPPRAPIAPGARATPPCRLAANRRLSDLC